MSFAQLERRYRELIEGQKRGEISAEEAAQAAQRLRFQDSDGVWWQIRPADGAWLRWNGSAWEEAQPPEDEGTGERPQTLAQYLRLLWRSLLRGLRRKLLLAGLAAFVTWIVHTYLLVGPNGGFAPGTNPTLDMVLALRDRILSGTLFWTLLAALVTTALARLRRVGLRQAVHEVRSAPGWLADALRSSEPLALSLLLFGGAALALLAGTLMDQRLIVLQLALVGLGVLVVRRQSVLWTVLRLGWADLQRLLRREKPADLNVTRLGVGTLGVTLGLLGAALQPFAPYGGIAGVVLLLVLGAYFLARACGRRGAARLFSLLLLLGLLALLVPPAFADDGGWSEGGANLASWLSSPGALRAMAIGLLPAAGVWLGVLLGSMFGSVSGISVGLEAPEVRAGHRRRAGRRETISREGPQPEVESPQEATQAEGPLRSERARGAAPGEPGRHGPEAPQEAGGEVPKAGPTSQPQAPTAEDAEQARGDEAATPAGGEQVAKTSAEQTADATQPDQAAGRPPDEVQTAGPGQVQEAAKRAPEPQVEPQKAARSEQVVKGEAAPERGAQQTESPTEADSAEAPSRSERARGPAPEEPGRRGPEVTPQRTGEPPEPGPSRLPQAPTAEDVERTLGDEEAPGEAQGGGQVATRPAEQGAEVTQAPQGSRRPPDEEQTAGSGRLRQAAKRAPQAEDRLQQTEERPTASHGRSQQAERPEQAAEAQAAEAQATAPSEQAPQPEATPEAAAADVADPGDTAAAALPGVADVIEESPWQVEVASGPGAGRRYVLGEMTRIGRGEDADLQLHDPKASRRHALVEWIEEGYRITDLGSGNGTFVNDRRIREPTRLRPGDRIRIGASELIVHA